jgi:hypothetical protein
MQLRGGRRRFDRPARKASTKVRSNQVVTQDARAAALGLVPHQHLTENMHQEALKNQCAPFIRKSCTEGTTALDLAVLRLADLLRRQSRVPLACRPSARHAPGRRGRAGPLHDGPQPQSAGAPRLGSDRGWERRPARARRLSHGRGGEAAIEAALPYWCKAQERIAALVQPSAIGEPADRLGA